MAKFANLNAFGDSGGSFGFGGGSNIGGGISGIGGAVSDLFAAEGKKAEAGNYRLAAGMSDKNAEYAALSTSIKNMQTERQIYQTIGEQTAGIAASGFTGSGSGGDLLRESMSQGALSHAVISQQGLIQEETYKTEAQAYRSMADAADKASTGLQIGAAIKGISAIAAFLGA